MFGSVKPCHGSQVLSDFNLWYSYQIYKIKHLLIHSLQISLLYTRMKIITVLLQRLGLLREFRYMGMIAPFDGKKCKKDSVSPSSNLLVS